MGLVAERSGILDELRAFCRTKPVFASPVPNSPEIVQLSSSPRVAFSVAGQLCRNDSPMRPGAADEEGWPGLCGACTASLPATAATVPAAVSQAQMHRPFPSASSPKALLGGINATVDRNHFGSQVQSFEVDLRTDVVSRGLYRMVQCDHVHAHQQPLLDNKTHTRQMKERGPAPGVFIRAPAIVEHGDDLEVLATLPAESRPKDTPGGECIVAARVGHYLVTSFHVRGKASPLGTDDTPLPSPPLTCNSTPPLLTTRPSSPTTPAGTSCLSTCAEQPVTRSGVQN